jgi:hypothetical protein
MNNAERGYIFGVGALGRTNNSIGKSYVRIYSRRAKGNASDNDDTLQKNQSNKI